MENKIFKLGLSVEAISLYLILFDLDSASVPLEMDSITARWNAPEGLLAKAVEELEMNSVVVRRGDVLEINPASVWTETRTA